MQKEEDRDYGRQRLRHVISLYEKDHSLQRGQDAPIRALCLVTYDVPPDDGGAWGQVYSLYDSDDGWGLW